MMFWHLLPGPVIRGQAFRIPPSTTAAWGEKKILFDEKTGSVWHDAEQSERAKSTIEFVLRQFWQSFVDDSFDLENALQTKAEFSYAIAVMDKIGGWEDEDLVGSRFATEAVICNGQNHM